MKSIKQQYIDLTEGRMSQTNFMRNLRMTMPQYVTNVTSFKDAVRILKNKGILTEAKTKLTADQVNNDELRMGIKVEMEHTKDKKVAEKIAMDHLYEDLEYYTKLSKVEAKEATSSASSGQYTTNKIWAKSMNKKDWRGASKAQIPGGKFVTVKEKCRKFPYCNQGDIKALNIFENQRFKDIISKIQNKYNISENVIKYSIINELNKNKDIYK
jgi:hypothetical protein